MTRNRRPSASPVCSADEAPPDYMLARALGPDELDGVLAALRRLEQRLGGAERRALIQRRLSDPSAAPSETVRTPAEAIAVIDRILPLVGAPDARADLERLRRLYGGA